MIENMMISSLLSLVLRKVFIVEIEEASRFETYSFAASKAGSALSNYT
jgi:hypothetical protein